MHPLLRRSFEKLLAHGSRLRTRGAHLASNALSALSGRLTSLAAAAARLRSGLPRSGRGAGRSLVTDILLLQLASALFVAVAAVAVVWWATSWVIDNNLNKWAGQWISELDDLGMPLYVDGGEEQYLRIENYIRSFPEISFVRYYSKSGDVVFEDATQHARVTVPVLGIAELEQLTRHGTDQPAQLDNSLSGSSVVRASKPIYTESMSSAGLLDLDLSVASMVQSELVGFVELGLDFGGYQTHLDRSVLTGSLISIGVLLFLAMVGSTVFRRALRPLAKLQEPLAKLASGDTDFRVRSSGHREIVAIADALNSTVSALHERDRRLHRLANHDSLTGLINRHRFSELLIEQLEEEDFEHTPSALLFIDLDQFKYINDTLGHAAGDRLLIQAARRLESTVRKNDQVSRFGGDEFTILLRDLERADVESICEALVQNMRDHLFVENGHSFSIPCSIGVTMIDSNRFSPAELMAQADMACHDAKARGRNRFNFYEASGQDQQQMEADIGWSQKIQKALADDALVVHFQPIVDLERGEPSHYEVLLRLPDETGELVPPDAFLPAANRFGLMVDIDRWVIRNALERLAGVRTRYGDIRFTLNVSGNIFEDTDLLGYIQEHLQKNDLPPDSLILEITEQIAVRNMINATEQMQELIELGCKFAIDDFGAGYSSFDYLKSLPVDYIKIDGAFIRDICEDVIDQTIVRSICEIARASGKQTIAEYVQDAATLDLLGELGVDYAQGFHIGKPSPRLRREPVSLTRGRSRKSRKKAG